MIKLKKRHITYMACLISLVSCFVKKEKASDLAKNTKLSNKIENISVDTAYIKSDSIDPSNNDLVLLYNSKNTLKRVYSVRNQDNSIAFTYKASVNNNKQKLICYEVADLTTGLIWNIIFNKKAKTFFVTDKYDTQALGDQIVKDSINFEKETAIVAAGDNSKNYSVKLKKIWP